VTRPIAVGATWLMTLGGAVALVAASRYGGSGLSSGGFSDFFAGLAFDVVVCATVGAILAMRKPGNRVGLLLQVAGALLAVTFLGFIAGALLTAERGEYDVLAGLAGLIGALGIYPTVVLAGPALALVFPDGHLPGPRWRWPVGTIAAVLLVGTALAATAPGRIGSSLAVNPAGVTGIPWLEAVSALGASLAALALPAALLVALAAIVVRFRRSRGAERQQLKWFVGANVMVALFLMLSLADGASEPSVFDVLAVGSLALPPIAVGMAILRYRLYEIDRIISRTVSWAVITGVLVAVVAVGVVAVQALLAGFTQGQTLAVAASTLAAFALFQPVRRRVQRAVDRRFDRARYDGERTAAAFAEHLRHEVDLGRVSAELTAAASATVRPRTATVWLRGGRA
jgi:hypothetical protein